MTTSNIRYAVTFSGIIVETFDNFANALAKEYELAVCKGLDLDRIEIKDYKKSNRPRFRKSAPTGGAPCMRLSRKSNYKMAA